MATTQSQALEQEQNEVTAMVAGPTTTKLQALFVTLPEVTALRATRAPSATELQALVATLQAEVTALRAARAAPTAVVFANLPTRPRRWTPTT